MSLAGRLVRSGAWQTNILTDGQHTVTYGELPARLAAYHAFFVRQGIGPGECLAVECPNTVAGALLILYLLQEEISFVLLPPSEQTEASVWKPVPRFCHARLVVERSATGDPLTGCLRLETNPAYAPPVASELAQQSHLFLRTSGSMGASKLVVHSHAALIANAQGCVEQYGYTAEDRMTIPVPIAHMYGLGVGFLPAILAGASIDLQDRTNLLRFLAHEKRFQPTVTCVTPTLCAMLLKGFKTPRRYRLAVTATQRIGEAAFRAFDDAIGGTFVNQYGSSEMGAIAVCQPDDEPGLKANSIGRPFPGVRLEVRDAGLENGDAGVGELYCQHPAAFLGYVDEAGDWLYRHPSAGWYGSGDLARALPDDCFQITGRSGNSMNRRGHLVQFAEIERLMEQVAGLEQVVVVGHSESETLLAFCVTSVQNGVTGGQIRERCFGLLPAYAIPDDVRLLERLPLLPSGKVDRQALARLAATER